MIITKRMKADVECIVETVFNCVPVKSVASEQILHRKFSCETHYLT